MFFQFRFNLFIIVLFVFKTSCTKTKKESSDSYFKAIGDDSSFVYSNSFCEVNLSTSQLLGDFVLNIEVTPYPADVTTDSFEFYMCPKQNLSQCQPSRDNPQFVEGLYEGYGYDYPLAPEGDNEVFVRACNNSLEKRICGIWQSFSYTQKASLDKETSDLIDASYLTKTTLDEMVTVVEDLSDLSFETDEDMTASLLDNLLGGKDAGTISDSNEETPINDSETIEEADSDSNQETPTNDSETIEEADSDSNEMTGADGFEFDPTFDEEEIATIVGVSAVSIAAIPLIVIYASKKKNNKLAIPQDLSSTDLEGLLKTRMKMLVELYEYKEGQTPIDRKGPAFEKKKNEIKKELDENNKAIQNRLLQDLGWEDSLNRLKTLEEIVALQETDEASMKNNIKKYLKSVLFEIESLDEKIKEIKEVLQKSEGKNDEKLLSESKIGILEEMKLSRIAERDNILKLAAGQKVNGLQIDNMKNLKKFALIEKTKVGDGSSKIEEFKTAMKNLLGVQDSLFNEKFSVEDKFKASGLSKKEFRNLIDINKINLSNLGASLEGFKSETKSDFAKLKFSLTASEKFSLANFLEKYAEDFKYLYELRNKINLALTLKEIESLE